MIQYFPVETSELSILQWTKNDSCVLAGDHSITYGFFAYSPTDALIFKEKDAGCLGIKHMQVSPNGDYVAILTFDEKLKIFNCVSWRHVLTVDLKIGEFTNYFQENDDTSRPQVNGAFPKKCRTSLSSREVTGAQARPTCGSRGGEERGKE